MFNQARVLVCNLAFLLSAFVILTLRMLPVDFSLGPVPTPDLLFCLIAAWKMRNPHLAHPALIVISVLAAELLFLQPLGLWTALVLLASEFFARIEIQVRFLPFTYEWLMMASAYTTAMIGYQLLLALFLVPVPEAIGLILQILTTIAAYPLVVAATNLVYRIRKVATIDSARPEGFR